MQDAYARPWQVFLLCAALCVGHVRITCVHPRAAGAGLTCRRESPNFGLMVALDQLVSIFFARQVAMAGLRTHALRLTAMTTCQPDADT